METLFTILSILAILWGLSHVASWMIALLIWAYSPGKRR